MRSVPGEFTTADGGGAEAVDAAMGNAVGVLVTPTTNAPVRVPGEGSTAARGVTAESRTGARGDGADAPTAPARIRGVRIATPKAGLRTARPARRRAPSRAARPPMCTQPSLGCGDL